MAYQGYGHGIDRAILGELYDIAVGDFPAGPSRLSSICLEAGLARAAKRRGSETRYEALPLEFHERVRAGFLDIAAADPERCIVIDATADIDLIAASIARAAGERLKV